VESSTSIFGISVFAILAGGLGSTGVLELAGGAVGSVFTVDVVVA